MDRKKNRMNWIGMLMAVLLIGWMSSASVFAQDYDSSAKGSITMTLEDIETTFEGTSFSCYKVADPDVGNTLQWKWIEGLQDVPVDLNQLQTAEDYKNAAETLAAKVIEIGLSGQQAQADAAGQVVFASLEQGVYLLVQEETAEYGIVEPFLIAIPYMDNGSEWVYDVKTQTKGTKKESMSSESPNSPTTEKEKKETSSTQTKNKTGVRTGGSTKTGDSNPVELYMILFVLAGCGIVIVDVIWYRRRRRRRNSNG